MFPELYHLGKNGALYSWKVWTEGDTIYSDTGQVNGKRVLSVKKATPKNTGKANATTASEQALKEARAMHKHKVTRKYALSPSEAQEEEIQPMLAQDFEKRKDRNVTYPCDFQPKVDGARALARWDGDRVILTSRGAREWLVPQHLNRELEKFLPKDCILDGELYIHGEDFQDLMSWVKRDQPNTKKLEYHVYDMPMVNGEDSLYWSERLEALDKFFRLNADNLQNIKQVFTFPCFTEKEVYDAHNDVVAQGYEGGIVRLLAGQYTYGYRSYDLLKVKAFQDGEFKVIGVKNGKGKFEKSAIWLCVDSRGEEFDVTPKCTQAEKERYLREADKYIGKLLTVEFNGFTDDRKVPRFGRGKGFRLEEDLPR